MSFERTELAPPYQRQVLLLVDEHLARKEGAELAALLQEAISALPDNVGVGLLTFGSCVRLYRVFSPLFVMADTFSAEGSQPQRQLQENSSKSLYVAPASKAFQAVMKAIESVTSLPAIHEDRALLAAVEVASTLAACCKLPTELSVLTSGPPLLSTKNKWRDYEAISEPLRNAWEELLPAVRSSGCLMNLLCVGCEFFHLDVLASFAAATGGTTAKGVSLREPHLRQSYLLQFCRATAQPTTVTIRTTRQLAAQPESTFFGQEASAAEHEALDVKSTLTITGTHLGQPAAAARRERSARCIELAEWSPSSMATFALQPASAASSSTSSSTTPEQANCFVQIVVRTQPSPDRLRVTVTTFAVPFTSDPATFLSALDVHHLLAVYARRAAKHGLADPRLRAVEEEVIKPWLRSK